MKWEYLVYNLGPGMRKDLNEYGSKGWELVSVTDDKAYFKRPDTNQMLEEYRKQMKKVGQVAAPQVDQ